MIIPNGTIQFKQFERIEGFNPNNGRPLKSKVSWGNPIECQYMSLGGSTYLQEGASEQRGYATYKVLIDDDLGAFRGTIMLKDSQGEVLGEFFVKSTERFRAVSQICLIV